MAKKKLICLFSFIMIFLIRGLIYSQHIPYQGQETTTDEGFKIKLWITTITSTNKKIRRVK